MRWEDLSPENRREAIARFEAKTEKRRYYLLSAAGATVGFTITQMNELNPNVGPWILIISLVLLGLSALFGICALNNSILDTQGQILLSDFDPKSLPFGKTRGALKAMIKEAKLDPLFKRMRLYDRLQILFLISGFFLVPIWSFARCEACTAYVIESFAQLK